MTKSEPKPILSTLAISILRKLAKGDMSWEDIHKEFPCCGAAIEELVEHGFIELQGETAQ